eukprot:6351323-Amphidinium_carterae.2
MSRTGFFSPTRTSGLQLDVLRFCCQNETVKDNIRQTHKKIGAKGVLHKKGVEEGSSIRTSNEHANVLLLEQRK